MNRNIDNSILDDADELLSKGVDWSEILKMHPELDAEIKRMESFVSEEKNTWLPSQISFFKTLSDIGVTKDILNRYYSVKSHEAINPEQRSGIAGRFGDQTERIRNKNSDSDQDSSDWIRRALQKKWKFVFPALAGLAFTVLLGLRINETSQNNIDSLIAYRDHSSEIAALSKSETGQEESDMVAKLAMAEEADDFNPTIDLNQI